MGFCLPKFESEKFTRALTDGSIEPGKLTEMTSAERHTFFSDLLGEANARDVNALFESKLLLKNQQAGMIRWAKQLSGLTETAKRDILSRIEKMDKILSPENEQVFLEDLASKKLGTDVTFEEAKQITEMSKELRDAREKLDPNEPDGSASRLEYGAKKVALTDYVNELKLGSESKSLVDRVSDIAGVAKGVKASMDVSAIFRQGWKALFSQPDLWAKNVLKSLEYLKQVGKKTSDNTVLNGVKADVYSRKNSVDGTYQRMKLDIGEFEEAYPTKLPEKFPIFGRFYKASEVHYTGFQYRLRADIADRYIGIFKKLGGDITDKVQAESIGKLVNSLTGRGYLGRAESLGKPINTVFFSPKMLKSSFDFLTAHQFQKDVTPFVRKQAIYNLIKVGTGVAIILGIAKAVDPDSVELDPRSAAFGKIKVHDMPVAVGAGLDFVGISTNTYEGNTYSDISAGMSSLMTLTARTLIPTTNKGKWGLYTKSSTSGKVTPLNSGKFGAKTIGGVLWDFSQNKLSPAASVVNDVWVRGEDFHGDKPTVIGEAKNLFEPLPIANIEEMIQSKNGNSFLKEILNSLEVR